MNETDKLYIEFINLWDVIDSVTDDAFYISQTIKDQETREKIYEQCNELIALTNAVAMEFEFLGYDCGGN